jgi:hypothetical protein
MCVRLHGADDKFNTGLQRDSVSKHIGLTFLGKVRRRPAAGGGEGCCLLQHAGQAGCGGKGAFGGRQGLRAHCQIKS